MYEIDNEELQSLELLFNSKKLFRYQGPGVETHCSNFEREFSAFIGVKHSLFVNSGTNAIFLALKALGIGKNDEVIVPSYTFIATIAAVISSGASPVVSNIGDDLTLDLSKLKKKLSTKTKAIIPVHMDGFPSDMEGIMKFADENGLLVIEDVAQAIGGEFYKKKLGSFGHASCFSFNVDKIISCGEGGLVAFNDEAFYKKALMLHDIPVSYGVSYKEYLSDTPYEFGYSMRMSEISGAIMRVQLRRVQKILTTLKMNKLKIIAELGDISDRLVLPKDVEGDCSTHVHLRFDDPIQTSQITKILNISGIPAQILYMRPGHCFWHWKGIDTVDLGSAQVDRIFLSTVFRIPVDFESSSDVVVQKAKQICALIKSSL